MLLLSVLFHTFHVEAEKNSTKLSTEKAKMITINCKEVVRCKSVVKDEMIEKVMQFKYLEIIMTSSKHLILTWMYLICWSSVVNLRVGNRLLGMEIVNYSCTSLITENITSIQR